MRQYVRRQTAALLGKLEREIARAAGDHSPDAIHDVRVAIRRLSRCLRVFAQFYPGQSWKKARAELAVLLHAAGAVRDRDIAVELLAKAGIAKRSVIFAKLDAERTKLHDEFVAEVRLWHSRKAVAQWRTRLKV
jgi:CHAD domain-containing protein